MKGVAWKDVRPGDMWMYHDSGTQETWYALVVSLAETTERGSMLDTLDSVVIMQYCGRPASRFRTAHPPTIWIMRSTHRPEELFTWSEVSDRTVEVVEVG